MDPERLASLTRVVRDCSRRGFLILSSAAVGGLALLVGQPVTEAK